MLNQKNMPLMNRNLTKSILLIVAAIFIANQYYSCKKLDIVRETMIMTVGAEGLGITNATLRCELIDLGEGNITEYGCCYSTSANPTIIDNQAPVPGTPELGIHGIAVSGLQPNTEYFFRAYALQESIGMVAYGGALSFTTLQGTIVETDSVYNITETTATCAGNISSDGGSAITKKGFCISTQQNPTIDDLSSDNGSGTGSFTHEFSGLTSNTTYYVRAYAQNAYGTAYGRQLSFYAYTGEDEWLHYDDGLNFDGIGLNNGGDFDVAIRFEPSQLANYDGWKITKFRFFPLNSFPTNYSIEIFTGADGNELEYLQDVITVTPEEWNEVILEEPYIIDASKPLYPGYWIQSQPIGEYPAGVDDGPAITESGDLISMDGGQSWTALSIANPDLDYNWNLQIYVTNERGEEQLLNPGPVTDPHKKTTIRSFMEVSSRNQTNR
jgi:hypothetical protein